LRIALANYAILQTPLSFLWSPIFLLCLEFSFLLLMLWLVGGLGWFELKRNRRMTTGRTTCILCLVEKKENLFCVGLPFGPKKCSCHSCSSWERRGQNGQTRHKGTIVNMCIHLEEAQENCTFTPTCISQEQRFKVAEAPCPALAHALALPYLALPCLALPCLPHRLPLDRTIDARFLFFF
jgi:hypothetical protein